MRCPKCSYDLRGTEGEQCPECGERVAVISRKLVKVPTWLMYAGLGLIAVYCVSETLAFRREYWDFNYALASGWRPEGEMVAESAMAISRLRFVSNMSLWIGLMCVALSLLLMFRRVVVLMTALEAKKAGGEDGD